MLGFLWGLSPQFAHSQLPFCCLFPQPLPCACTPGVSLCVQMSSSCKDTSQIRLGPILTVSFYCNHLFKGLISKYSHILRFWGLDLQHMNSGGDRIQPTRILLPNPIINLHWGHSKKNCLKLQRERFQLDVRKVQAYPKFRSWGGISTGNLENIIHFHLFGTLFRIRRLN